MMRSSLLLLACLILVMLVGDADAKEPEWSYETGEAVLSVAISADGEYIAAGSFDDNVYLFGKDSSTPLWSYTTEYGVTSVDISADGEYITAGCVDGKVYLFDKDSSTPLWNHTTGDWVNSVAISADGEYIAAGSDWPDNKVYLFDKDSSIPLWSYSTGGIVWSVAISTDGEYVVAGSDDDKVYLFGKDNNTPLWSYTAGDGVFSVAISSDRETIVAGSLDNNVYLFSKDGTLLWSYGTGNWVWSVAISADGEYIAAGSRDDKLYLFGKDSRTPLWSYNAGSQGFRSVAISADGEYITAGSDDSRVYLFDKDSSTPFWSYDTGNHVLTVDISADGKYTVAGSGSEDNVYLFHNNLPPTATIDSITPSPARFDAEVTFSGSGSDSDGTVVAYEWTSSIDGFLSDEEDFIATGLTIGTHAITFIVQDNDGDWSEWDNTTVLVIYPNTPPVGTLDSIEPLPAEKGDEVTFNGTGSDSDGTVVSYLWKSSIDGELSTEEDFSNNSLSLGHHSITFRVQDNDGDWSGYSDYDTLWIYAVPIAIAGQDSTGTPGVPLQFSGAATDEDGTVVLYEWDFDGDGVFEWSSTENGLNTYIYNNEGTYTATLRVTDNDGFTDTDTVEIIISEKKIQIDDDDGNVTVTDAEEDEEGIPTLSVITTMAAVAVMALRRRPE